MAGTAFRVLSLDRGGVRGACTRGLSREDRSPRPIENCRSSTFHHQPGAADTRAPVQEFLS